MFNIEDNDEFYSELLGRLRSIEILLEISMAQAHSYATEKEQEESLQGIVAMLHERSVVNPNTSEEEQEFQEKVRMRMLEHVETRISNISKRAHSLREAMKER